MNNSINGNFSPSASVEANLIKYERHVESGSGIPKGDLVRSVLEAIAPRLMAKRYSDAAQITAKNVAEIAEDLVNAGTPREYAISQAYGIYRSAEKLANVTKAISYAGEEMKDDAVYSLPEKTFMDYYISTVEAVGDDDVLRLFGKILAGEMEQVGRVSPFTLDAVRKMRQIDAQAFEKFCACSIEVLEPDGSVRLMPCPRVAAFDKFRLSQDEEESLDALGLTKIRLQGFYVATLFLFGKDNQKKIKVSGNQYIIERGKSDISFIVPELTKYGKELASLCKIGCALGFEESFLGWLRTEGADIRQA